MADLKTEMQRVAPQLALARLSTEPDEGHSNRRSTVMDPIAVEQLMEAYGVDEAAEMIGYTVQSVKQALRRGQIAAPAELAAQAILKAARMQSERIFLVRVPVSKVDGFKAVTDALGLHPEQF